ncbi:MAG: acyl-CoA dehydrogenase family protein [Crinalium sp.]
MLPIAESYLREIVAPQAAAIDTDAKVLQNAIAGLGDRNLLALRIPKAWGGAEVDHQTFWAFQEMVARYSGALAFLQTQHQSAGTMLVSSKNEALKQQYLPNLGSGKLLIGVGFAHLRRQGISPVKALPVEGGYQLNGEVPWVTGWNFFQDFIVGATLPNGESVFGIIPLKNISQNGKGEIFISTPLSLAAMESTNTVKMRLSEWFLPQESVLFIKPAGWIHENDKKNILNPGFFALGCARAGLDIVEATAKIKQLDFIDRAFQSLEQELISCRTAMFEHQPTIEEKLKIRALAIDLAVRCAHAGVTVSSGAANNKYHAAQRVYREALMFTVVAQTTAVMEATLARLIRI